MSGVCDADAGMAYEDLNAASAVQRYAKQGNVNPKGMPSLISSPSATQ
jgi:hypothetical protein